jgi:hypothetical protein
VLNEEEQTLLEFWKKQNFFDVPVTFEQHGNSIMITYMSAGMRCLDIVDATDSNLVVGGFGHSTTTHSQLKVAIALGAEGSWGPYRHAIRRAQKMKVLGTWEGDMPLTTLCEQVKALKFGKFKIDMRPDLNVRASTPLQAKVLEFVWEDGRPVILYHEDGPYKKLFESNDISVVSYPSTMMGEFDDSFINICPVHFGFLPLTLKRLCMSHGILTPFDVTPTGLEVGTFLPELKPTGQLGVLQDYQYTNVVSDIAKVNEVVIRRTIDRMKPTMLVFPGDGNGVGARVAERLGVPYRSGDIFPRDPRVHFETAAATLRAAPEGVVVLSRVMQFLSKEEKELLEGRQVVVIDRHHIYGWYRSYDGLVSTSVPEDVPTVPLQDRSTTVPAADLPFFLINYAPLYEVDLVDDDLISLCRFIRLHNWNTSLNVPNHQKGLVKSYNIPLSNDRGVQLGNTPLASVDFYSGVALSQRTFVEGLPRMIGVNDVCLLRDEPEVKGGHIVRLGTYFAVRFKEPGYYKVKLNRSTTSNRTKFKVSEVQIEVIKGHNFGLSNDMIVGSGKILNVADLRNGII